MRILNQVIKCINVISNLKLCLVFQICKNIWCQFDGNSHLVCVRVDISTASGIVPQAFIFKLHIMFQQRRFAKHENYITKELITKHTQKIINVFKQVSNKTVFE